jgi:hypothetical protein
MSSTDRSGSVQLIPVAYLTYASRAGCREGRTEGIGGEPAGSAAQVRVEPAPAGPPQVHEMTRET